MTCRDRWDHDWCEIREYFWFRVVRCRKCGKAKRTVL